MSRRVAPTITPNPSEVLSLTAHCGAESVTYKLVPTATGLYVERLQVRAHRWRIVHAMLFDDEASFVRWSERENVKFEHPLVYTQLQRDGCALLHRRH